MSSFDNEDFNPDRFSIENPVLDTQRYLFDVSNIPVGDLLPFQSVPGESTPDSQEFIRRNLFPDPDLVPTFRPHISGNNTQITDHDTQMNVVTMGGTVDTSLIAVPPPPPPMQQQEPLVITQPASKMPSQRKRFSYRHKFFYADSEIYLQLNAAYPLPEESPPELVGYVEVCPQKRNGDVYQINWMPRTGVEWPTNLRHHLRTKFDKAFLHPHLKKWIQSCPLNEELTPAETAPRPAGHSSLLRPQPPQPRQPRIVDMTTLLQTTTTPAASQRSAFAALHTAGSVAGYTGISSLTSATGGSTTTRRTTPANTRRTRNNNEAGCYDSDDEYTDDEAGYELNPLDGFWNNTGGGDLEAMDELSDTGDNASTASPVAFATVGAQVPDLGTLIGACTEFPFTELTPEEANEWMHTNSPQKLYNGESGLKRGVASSFDTALEAFARSGFTPELIMKYTVNSNRYVSLHHSFKATTVHSQRLTPCTFFFQVLSRSYQG